MGTDAKGQAGRGRPADPDIERRVIAAALAVYGEVGWAGFTLDRVDMAPPSNEKFRAAVQAEKLGPDGDIPHLSKEWLLKYATDMKHLGWL